MNYHQDWVSGIVWAYGSLISAPLGAFACSSQTTCSMWGLLEGCFMGSFMEIGQFCFWFSVSQFSWTRLLNTLVIGHFDCSQSSLWDRVFFELSVDLCWHVFPSALANGWRGAIMDLTMGLADVPVSYLLFFLPNISIQFLLYLV